MNEQQLFEHYLTRDIMFAFIVLSRMGSDRPCLYSWHGLMTRTTEVWSAK